MVPFGGRVMRELIQARSDVWPGAHTSKGLPRAIAPAKTCAATRAAQSSVFSRLPNAYHAILHNRRGCQGSGLTAQGAA